MATNSLRGIRRTSRVTAGSAKLAPGGQRHDEIRCFRVVHAHTVFIGEPVKVEIQCSVSRGHTTRCAAQGDEYPLVFVTACLSRVRLTRIKRVIRRTVSQLELHERMPAFLHRMEGLS